MIRLKELRKKNKLTQQQLAKMLGITQATLSGWENEKFGIDNGSLIKCAKILNVSTDYILGKNDINANAEINSHNTITGTYNVIGNNSQISIKDELSKQEQELISCFRKLGEMDKAKTLLNIAELLKKGKEIS